MKKINRFAIYLVLSIYLVLVVSCKKDREEPVANKTKIELLTQKPWILTSTDYLDNETWAKHKTPAYELDDQYIFRANGTLEHNDGATRESPNNPQIKDCMTWKFVDNETKIRVDNQTNIIEMLSETAFQLILDDGLFRYRYTFAH